MNTISALMQESLTKIRVAGRTPRRACVRCVCAAPRNDTIVVVSPAIRTLPLLVQDPGGHSRSQSAFPPEDSRNPEAGDMHIDCKPRRKRCAHLHSVW